MVVVGKEKKIILVPFVYTKAWFYFINLIKFLEFYK